MILDIIFLWPFFLILSLSAAIAYPIMSGAESGSVRYYVGLGIVIVGMLGGFAFQMFIEVKASTGKEPDENSDENTEQPD